MQEWTSGRVAALVVLAVLLAAAVVALAVGAARIVLLQPLHADWQAFRARARTLVTPHTKAAAQVAANVREAVARTGAEATVSLHGSAVSGAFQPGVSDYDVKVEVAQCADFPRVVEAVVHSSPTIKHGFRFVHTGGKFTLLRGLEPSTNTGVDVSIGVASPPACKLTNAKQQAPTEVLAWGFFEHRIRRRHKARTVNVRSVP